MTDTISDDGIKTWLYCVAFQSEGPTKIGITANCGQRLAEIQWGLPYVLKMHFAYSFESGREAGKAEYHLLDFYGDCRLTGEWVDRPFAEVRSLIIEYAERDSIVSRTFDFSASEKDLEYVRTVMRNQEAKRKRNKRLAVEHRAYWERNGVEADREANAKGISPALLRYGPPGKIGPEEAEAVFEPKKVG